MRAEENDNLWGWLSWGTRWDTRPVSAGYVTPESTATPPALPSAKPSRRRVSLPFLSGLNFSDQSFRAAFVHTLEISNQSFYLLLLLST